MACNMSSDMTSNGNIATDLNSVQQCLRLLKTKTLVFCGGASSLQVNQVSATTCVECLPVKSFMYCISDIFTQPMTQRDKKKKLTLTSVSITSSPDRVVWTTINDSRIGIHVAMFFLFRRTCITVYIHRCGSAQTLNLSYLQPFPSALNAYA